MSSLAATAPTAATTAQRRRDIKAGNDPTDLRRRRADTTISLRKAKKEQGLAAKRRNITAASQSAASGAAEATGAGATTAGAAAAAGGASGAAEGEAVAPARQYTPADVPELAHNLRSAGDAAIRVEAARGLRKVLSLESDPPVDAVITAGAMPLLVMCLDQTDHTDLQVREGSVQRAKISQSCRVPGCGKIDGMVSRDISGIGSVLLVPAAGDSICVFKNC